MHTYGVTITLSDFYYEVDAENKEQAMDEAFDLAFDEVGNLWDLYPECNEVVQLDKNQE